MQVFVAGLSFRSVPLPILERASLAGDQLRTALVTLPAGLVSESVVLSTCNRVEVYTAVERFHEGGTAVHGMLVDTLAGGRAVPVAVPPDGVYAFNDRLAVEHLFTVASGLDSLVVGETEILGQVRSAFRRAQSEETVGPVLSALFRHALFVGRRVRHETDIGAGHSSVVSAGLELAGAALGGDLNGHSVLLVGTGHVARLTGRRLAAAGAARIVVAGRTPAAREELARTLHGSAIGLDDLGPSLRTVDLVVASTSARARTVPAEVVVEASQHRRDRPLVILDLGIPRDVAPEIAALPGVELIDLDALRLARQGQASEEPRAEREARTIVAQQAKMFGNERAQARLAPTIRALHERAELLREGELAKVSARLAGLTDEQHAAVVAVTRGLVNKLLHDPVTRGKALAAGPRGDLYAAVLRELYGLDDDGGVATPE